MIVNTLWTKIEALAIGNCFLRKGEQPAELQLRKHVRARLADAWVPKMPFRLRVLVLFHCSVRSLTLVLIALVMLFLVSVLPYGKGRCQDMPIKRGSWSTS